MMLLSIFVSGGFLHSIIFTDTAWFYLMLMMFASTSSLVTGVLMIVDGVHYRFKEEIDKISQNELPEEAKEHILSLEDTCKRLRPETISESHE
jgi:hypothetical protein